MDWLTGLTIGLQIATAHYGGGASEQEWFTPGVYAMHPTGATVSLYRNSQGRGSAVVGWTLETPSRTFALTVGAVTGYERQPVLPMFAPSVRWPIGDYAVRVLLVPPLKKYDVVGAATVAVERVF